MANNIVWTEWKEEDARVLERTKQIAFALVPKQFVIFQLMDENE
jgi:hypothetical protein